MYNLINTEKKKMLTNINRSLFQNFPFHLVTISPWPILVSFSLLSLTLGAVLSMHGYGSFTFLLGLASTGLGMLLWFRDIILEATYLGCHTTQVQKGLTMGVILFIVSEVFAFLSVFWAFFHSSLSPSIEIGGVWPPQGVEALSAFGIPLLNTFLLLSSGSTITYGHHALIKGDRKQAIIGGLLTIILAIVFVRERRERDELGRGIGVGYLRSVGYIEGGGVTWEKTRSAQARGRSAGGGLTGRARRCRR